MVRFSLIFGLVFILVTPWISNAEVKKPYKMGVVFDLSGSIAFIGIPKLNAMKLLAEEVNKTGGIDGHPIELVVYDSESDTSKSTTALMKLIKGDKVSMVFGDIHSGVTLSLIPIVEKEQIALVTCSMAPSISNPVKKWVFQPIAILKYEVERVVTYLKSKGVKRIALLVPQTARATEGKTEMEIQAKGAGLEIVSTEICGGDDIDVTPQLTKIRGTTAEAVYCPASGKIVATVAKCAKQVDLKKQIILSAGFPSQKYLDLVGEAANNVVLAPAFKVCVVEKIPFNDPQKQALMLHKKLYEERYKSPVDNFTATGWDHLMVAIRAFERAKSDDRAKFRDALEKEKDFPCTLGIHTITPTKHDSCFINPYVMVQVVDGKFELVQ